MKTLYIVRHGKSSWDYSNISDIDRPLKKRGINDAYDMSSRLKDSGNIPDLIITSPAARALHTAVIFSRVLEIPENRIVMNYDLYMAEENNILDVVYGIDDDVNSAMIFGHNPGFTEFANYVTRMRINNVPTTGLVHADYDIDNWNMISKHKIIEEDFDYPKNK